MRLGEVIVGLVWVLILVVEVIVRQDGNADFTGGGW